MLQEPDNDRWLQSSSIKNALPFYALAFHVTWKYSNHK